MARIDLARRAQIGRDRRARTRSQLVEAARGLFADRPVEAVTIDDVVGAAAVADDLARQFDELLQPRRLALSDPVERIAAGCAAFIGQALREPSWGALVARSAASMPSVARLARERLSEDVRRAAAAARLGDVTPGLAYELAIGIVLRTMQAAAEGGLATTPAQSVVAAILRAIGVKPAEARRVAARVTAQDQQASPAQPSRRR